MPIEQLRIRNFKSIRREAVIDFAKLTFLYGPNSAGKSSVIDAITVLTEALAKISYDFEALDRLTNDEAKAQNEGIRLGVTFYIEGKDLAHFGNAQFKNLDNTLKKLAEGSRIEIDIELFARARPDPVKELMITVDGDQVIGYKRERTSLGPFLKPIAKASSEALLMPIITNLIGEWRIWSPHPFAIDILIEPKSRCKRSSLAFCKGDTDDITVIKGIGFSYESDHELIPIVHPLSLDLVFPPNPETTIFAAEFPSRLYKELRLLRLDGAQGIPDEHYTHRAFLEQFYEADDLSKNYSEYMRFLRSEFSMQNSAEILADLQDQSRRLATLLSALFWTASEAIATKRIRGNRSAFDSSHPIHLKNQMETYFSHEPVETKSLSGEALFHAADASPLFEGFGQLSKNTSNCDDDIPRIVAEYTSIMLGENLLFPRKDGQTDFLGYALKSHLRSLSQYEIIPEIYTLTAPTHSMYEDDTGLTESRLVFYTLRNLKGERLFFSEVGSALGYVFPILTGITSQRSLAIEQPELHLHAVAQDQLADVFISALYPARIGTDNRCFIIESHSEVFLLRIAARISSGFEIRSKRKSNVKAISSDLTISHDDVRIYYFNPRSDGSTDIESIRFAEDGTLIESWPSGMFANDWTSGLSRLKLFSDCFSMEDAQKILPWISNVDDKQIRKWLKTSALLEIADEGTAEVASIIWAKITEKALLDNLLTPIRDLIEVANWHEDRNLIWLEKTLKEDFLRKKRAPMLAWWWTTFSKMRTAHRNEPQYFSLLRSQLESEQFKNSWTTYSYKLLDLLWELKEVRNPAAHHGRFDLKKFTQARQIIADGRGPGVLFLALGLLKAPAPLRGLSGDDGVKN